MALKLVNSGEKIALEYLVNKDMPEDLVLRLFKSDTTPAESDTASTYTEADFTGYSAVTLTGASWTVTEGNPTEATYAEQAFTSGATQAAQTIYGYYLTRATSADLVWVERFSSSQTVQNNGDRISISPLIQAKDAGD